MKWSEAPDHILSHCSPLGAGRRIKRSWTAEVVAEAGEDDEATLEQILTERRGLARDLHLVLFGDIVVVCPGRKTAIVVAARTGGIAEPCEGEPAEVGGSIGKGIREFKKLLNEIGEEVRTPAPAPTTSAAAAHDDMADSRPEPKRLT